MPDAVSPARPGCPSPPLSERQSPAGRPDVVFTFSYSSWRPASQRGWFAPEDRLARALAIGDERVGRVLVSDLMRSLPAKLVRDRISTGGTPFPASERAQLLQPVGLRRRYPSDLRGAERACAAYDRALRRGAQRMGLEDPVVITAHPLLAGLAEFSWARAVTFYATDDWALYEPHRRWWPVYEESFRRLAGRGRRVAAVSPQVLERLAPTGTAVVVPNGLEPQEWVGDASPPSWAQGLRRPLFLYAGTLDSRLDVDAILAIAEALREATLLFVGPLVDPGWLEPLRGVGNIEIRSPVGRSELAALARSADVGLIPYRGSEFTTAMSPLKLYEYLAAGLPVLASDLAPMRGVDPARVTLVPEGADFVAGVRSAMALGRARESHRVAFVEENSWRARHGRLLDLALA